MTNIETIRPHQQLAKVFVFIHIVDRKGPGLFDPRHLRLDGRKRSRRWRVVKDLRRAHSMDRSETGEGFVPVSISNSVCHKNLVRQTDGGYNGFSLRLKNPGHSGDGSWRGMIETLPIHTNLRARRVGFLASICFLPAFISAGLVLIARVGASVFLLPLLREVPVIILTFLGKLTPRSASQFASFLLCLRERLLVKSYKFRSEYNVCV